MCYQARSDRSSMVIVTLKEGDNVSDVIRWLSMIIKVIFITKSRLHSAKTAFCLHWDTGGLCYDSEKKIQKRRVGSTNNGTHNFSAYTHKVFL